MHVHTPEIPLESPSVDVCGLVMHQSDVNLHRNTGVNGTKYAICVHI